MKNEICHTLLTGGGAFSGVGSAFAGGEGAFAGGGGVFVFLAGGGVLCGRRGFLGDVLGEGPTLTMVFLPMGVLFRFFSMDEPVRMSANR